MRNIRINGYKVIDKSAESYKPDSLALMETIASGLKNVDKEFDKIKTIEHLSASYELASMKDKREVRSMESDFKLFGTGKLGLIVGGVGMILGVVAIIAIVKKLAFIAKWLKDIASKIGHWLVSILGKLKFKINKDGKDEATAKSVINKLIAEITNNADENVYKKLDYYYVTGDKRADNINDKINELMTLSSETDRHIQGITKDLTRVLSNLKDSPDQTGQSLYTYTQGNGKKGKSTSAYAGIGIPNETYAGHSSLVTFVDKLRNANTECLAILSDENISGIMTDKQAYEYLNKLYHDMEFGTALNKKVKDTEHSMGVAEANFNSILNMLNSYQGYESVLKNNSQVPIIADWNLLKGEATSTFQNALCVVKLFERCATNVTKTYNSIIQSITELKERKKFEDITSKKM